MKTKIVAVEKAVKTTKVAKPMVKKSPIIKESGINVNSELKKISEAYSKAIDGVIKFSEVKEMFKKLHKEVKKSK